MSLRRASLLHPCRTSSGRAWFTKYRRKPDHNQHHQARTAPLTTPSLGLRSLLRPLLLALLLCLLSPAARLLTAAQPPGVVTTPDTIPLSVIPNATFSPPFPVTAFNLTTLPNATVPNATTPLAPVDLIVILPLFSQATDNSIRVEPAFSAALQQLGRQGVVMTYIAATMFNAHSSAIYKATYNDTYSGTVFTLNVALQTGLIVADEGCDPTIAVPALIAALELNNSDSVGVIGPACTAATQPAAIIASYYNLPSISYAATSDDLDNKVTYPTFFRTAADLASEVSAVVPIMQQYGWQHLLVLMALDILQEGVLDDLIAQMTQAGLTLTDWESYTTGSTDYGSIQPVLSSLSATGGNVWMLYGDNVTDCMDILALAYNQSLLGDGNVWIIHPDCDIQTVLDMPVTVSAPYPYDTAMNITVAQLLQGHLYYAAAVADTTAPLYQAVTASYNHLVSAGTRLAPGTSLPNASTPLQYDAFLAFDTTLSYMLAFQGLLQQAIVPARSSGPQLTGALGRVVFPGVTGLVNYSATTGRRFGVGWSLLQIGYAAAGYQPLTLGFITLSGEHVVLATDPTQVATIEPYCVLVTNASVLPAWQGGQQPTDNLIRSSSNPGATAGIIVGSVIGGVLLFVGCVLCVGVVRRNIQRNANILREAKDEAIRAQLEAETADRQKSQFLSTMSHEIRTPMNGVIGYGQLLSSSGLSAEQIEYVEGITVSTDHLLTVINDILDFHSVERGEMEIEYSTVRLQQVVEQAVNIAYRPAFSSHLEVLTFIDPSLPDLIIGDTTRLRQILANLLSNSLKFSSTTTGQIMIVLCQAGERAAIRELVPFPIVPHIDGMWVVGEGRWDMDALEESRVGRVEADVSGMEREKAKDVREDQERMERMREELKLKRKIKSIMANLKAKRDLTDSSRDVKAPATVSASNTPRPSPALSPTPQPVTSVPALHHPTIATTEEKQPRGQSGASVVSPPSGANGRFKPAAALASPTRLEEIELQPKSTTTPDDYSITIITSPPPQPAHTPTATTPAHTTHTSVPPSAASTQPPTPNLPLSHCERLSIQCTIEDQGVGISPANQRKLFSRFSQVHSGYPGGTGLGLAISVFLSHLMGGTMWVVSQEGKGSRFGFSFASVAEPALLGGQGVLVGGGDGSNGAVPTGEQVGAGAVLSVQPAPQTTAVVAVSPPTATVDEHGSPLLPVSPLIERANTLYRPAQPLPSTQSLYCFPRQPRPQLGLSILIVDDNIDLLRLTATTLTSYGCAVFCASNAVAAMTFVCTVYKLPMQPLQIDEDERRSPREQTRDLPRQSCGGGSSPRNKSGLSVALPAKLDVIMIDYFLQPAVKEEKKVDGELNGNANGDSSGAAVRVNGMQLARIMYKRLNQQQQRRMLKSANEVYIASSTIPTTGSPPNTTTALTHSSPNQLRRRLVNNTSRAPLPSSRQPAIHEELPSPQAALPPLSRPHSFPDKGIAALSTSAALREAPASNNSSPLLHIDRLSLCISLNLPAFLLMVGLAEEATLAAHHSPHKEVCLSGKLRKPLAESQLRKVLEGIQARQKEMEDDKAKHQTKQQQQQQQHQQQQQQHHSLSLKELRSTSAPAQHIKPTALASPTDATAAPKARPSIAARYPLKLLYAEDNVVNQRLLTRMLSKFGYMAVRIAENGQVALDMLEEERAAGRPMYDLVFMDMQMPIKGGVEASTEIRQLYREEERPFICGVTANAMESDRQKCLSVMDDYLSKPVSLTTLEQVLVKWGAKVMARERKKAAEQSPAGGAHTHEHKEHKEQDDQTEAPAASAAGENLLSPHSQPPLHVNVNAQSTSSSRSPSSTPSMGSPAALSTPASAAGASLPTVSSLIRLTSNRSTASTASTATIASSPASQLLPLSSP